MKRKSRKWTFNNHLTTMTKRKKRFTKQTEVTPGQGPMTMKDNSPRKHKHERKYTWEMTMINV